MSGLREYERDPSLPALAGDRDLCPPAPDRLTALVESALRRDETAHATDARLCHVRWKPHVALAALYAVRFDDGSERLVTWKRYATDKAERVARGRSHAREVTETRLVPRVAWPAERVVLSSFPWDRELPGLARAFDTKRTCRALAATPRFEGVNLRQRRSSTKLVRYKPERRAVVRFDAVSRDAERRLETTRIGVRVLPPAEAARAVRARVASGLCALGIAPRLVGADSRGGLVFEEWLEVRSLSHDDFASARAAGEALGRLHVARCDAVVGAGAEDTLAGALPLFEVDRRLWTSAHAVLAAASARESRRVTWIHGDFHPDQTAAAADRLVVLDWDALAAGDPLLDVASWMADAIVARAEGTLEDFERGYRSAGGAWFTAREIDAAVSVALLSRAAAALRRLERDAVGKAAQLLERARLPAAARGGAA